MFGMFDTFRSSRVSATARFDGFRACRAEGTVLGLVGHDIHLQDAGLRSLKPHFSVASVDDAGRARDDAAGLLGDFDDLKNGASGRDDIFDDQNTLTRFDLESPSQLHDLVGPFGKDRPDSQDASHLCTDHDTADGRRYNEVHVLARETVRDELRKRVEVFGILQHLRTLKIVRAVQPRRELKMAIQKGAGGTKDLEDAFFVQFHAVRVWGVMSE